MSWSWLWRGLSTTVSQLQGYADVLDRMSMCSYLWTMVNTWDFQAGTLAVHLMVLQLLHLSLKKGSIIEKVNGPQNTLFWGKRSFQFYKLKILLKVKYDLRGQGFVEVAPVSSPQKVKTENPCVLSCWRRSFLLQ